MTNHTHPTFETRGIVLIASDLSLAGWPAHVAQAGLNTIALHAPDQLDALARFVYTEKGQQFLADCERYGLQVEYALHAMSDLLPRTLFDESPELFPMDAGGRRVKECNCCPSSSRALEIIAQRAVAYAYVFSPTTHRYFYWPDDMRDWCMCEQCRALNPSDQSLLVENAILRGLRRHDPLATLSHLAYGPTLAPPAHVQPEPGIFLEFAPINRSHERPFAEQTDPALHDRLEVLDANLAVFPRATAQALEYWLDVSRFSKWRRPAVKLPWRPNVLRADLDTYAARGIRHATTFACYVDADYATMYGEPWKAIEEYGAALNDDTI